MDTLVHILELTALAAAMVFGVLLEISAAKDWKNVLLNLRFTRRRRAKVSSSRLIPWGKPEISWQIFTGLSAHAKRVFLSESRHGGKNDKPFHITVRGQGLEVLPKCEITARKGGYFLPGLFRTDLETLNKLDDSMGWRSRCSNGGEVLKQLLGSRSTQQRLVQLAAASAQKQLRLLMRPGILELRLDAFPEDPTHMDSMLTLVHESVVELVPGLVKQIEDAARRRRMARGTRRRRLMIRAPWREDPRKRNPWSRWSKGPSPYQLALLLAA